MIVYPNAKINLGLNIIDKRPDGFHNIESLFLPIDLCDILEITQSDTKNEFSSSGIPIPGESKDNLCLLAWEQLQRDHHIPPVLIHLHKVIPIGAGLGGGSADGAFMLKALNELFSLNIKIEKLEEYAADLGSDCAFFIRNKPAFAEGRGEILNEIELELTELKIALINPGIHISTKEAYSGVSPTKPNQRLRELINTPLANWQETIINDFEPEISVNHPAISKIKEQLLSSGAQYAAMTGSGSSIFGIFNTEIPVTVKQNFSDYFYWEGTLST